MTDLRSALDGYLSLRQGLGYKYQQQARRLTNFVSFMEARKATTITTRLLSGSGVVAFGPGWRGGRIPDLMVGPRRPASREEISPSWPHRTWSTSRA